MGHAFEFNATEAGPFPSRGNGPLDQRAANAVSTPILRHRDAEASDVAIALPCARPDIEHADDLVTVRRDKDQSAVVGFCLGDQGALLLFGRRRPAANGAQAFCLQGCDVISHCGCVAGNRRPDNDFVVGHGSYGRASLGAGRQTSSRFSTKLTITSITITKAAKTNMPANTPATSNTPSAC
jgi:hypothetical protein